MRLFLAKSVNKHRQSLLDCGKFSVRKGLFGSLVLRENELRKSGYDIEETLGKIRFEGVTPDYAREGQPR